MDSKQYLKQAYRLNELIESDMKELENLRDLASSISSPQMSDMPHLESRNMEAPFTKCVGRIVEMEHKINDEIDRYVDLRTEIRTTINDLKNNDEKLLLRYRYILFMTWEEVAGKLNASMRTVHRIHGNALRNLKVPKKMTHNVT